MSAGRLRRLLPISGHILHMPGHIYMLAGDYRLAAECNEEAVKVNKGYIARFGLHGIYPLYYMSHKLYFLSRAYSMEGRLVDAKREGDELYDFYVPHYRIMPELEYYVPTSLFVLLRFNRWEEVLTLPFPPKEMETTQALWHYGRALAFAHLNRGEEAAEEQSRFVQLKDVLPPEQIVWIQQIRSPAGHRRFDTISRN
jgi:tetratricopeptide (TPR) repeat protein